MEVVRQIKGQPNIYMAMNSILYEIYKHNSKCLKIANHKYKYIKTVVLPFLGTGFGELSYEDSANQMMWSYTYFVKHYPDMF